MPQSLRERLVDMLRAMFSNNVAEKQRRRRPPRPPRDPRDKALVPVGPPKRPRPSSAIALPLPEPEEWDVEAIGRSIDPDVTTGPQDQARTA